MNSSETSNTAQDEPYITHDDVSEAQRLQDLAGVGYGGTLLDEQSELHETLGELGIFAQQEEVR